MSRIADLNQRGILHKQRGELGAAVTCYQQAIQLQPGFAEAHFNLGILYRDCGDVDQAIACLERTLRLRPDVAEVRLELGWLYVRQERWREASDTFASVIARQPTDVAALLGLAVVSREQGRPEEAIGLYERVLRIAPRNAAALTNLGNLRKDGGDLEAARSCYQAAIVAQPELVEPHINLGNLWLETGETEAAYAEYLIAAQLAPRQAKVQISLGNALQRLQRIPEAAAAYQRALELDPNEQDAWLYLTHLLKEIGDDRQARLVCQQLACRAPRDPLAALRAAAACPLTFYSAEELAEYRAELRDLLPTLAGHDWKIEFERWTVYAPECPYHLQFLDGNLCELKAAYAAVWAKALQKFDPGISLRLPKRSRPKIGFVVTARHDRAFVKLLGGGRGATESRAVGTLRARHALRCRVHSAGSAAAGRRSDRLSRAL